MPADIIVGPAQPARTRLAAFMFVALILLSVVQQYPLIRDNAYELIRLMLYGGFVVLLATALSTRLNTRSTVFLWMIAAVSSFLSICLIVGILTGQLDTGNTTQHIIPLILVLCSLSIPFTETSLNFLIRSYIVFALGMGLSTVISDVGGFTVTDIYMVTAKNQVGAILGVACVYALVIVVSQTKDSSGNKASKLGMAFVFIALYSCLVVVRNRAGLFSVTLILIILFMVVFQRSAVLKRLAMICGVLAGILVTKLLGLFDIVFALVSESITGNYDVTDLNSVSAGRWERYTQALDFISKYPLLGEISSPEKMDLNPHMYALSMLVDYGILGSLPLIALYIFLWRRSINLIFKHTVRSDATSFAAYGLFFALLISLFEYSAPYGPGVTFISVWFLIGQSELASNSDVPAEEERRQQDRP